MKNKAIKKYHFRQIKQILKNLANKIKNQLKYNYIMRYHSPIFISTMNIMKIQYSHQLTLPFYKTKKITNLERKSKISKISKKVLNISKKKSQ